MKTSFKQFLSFLAGIIFAVLWASASAATKIGLQSAQPFVIAIARFALASLAMLVTAHLLMGHQLPSGKRAWRQLAVYGFLNVGLYLGLYVWAMQEVSAGLGALFVAANPVLIVLIGAAWYKQQIRADTVVAFALCLGGMLLAAYPLFRNSYESPRGLAVLFISMLSYSAGSVYFSRKNWYGLHILTINGWQTLFGGLCLLPFMLISLDPEANILDFRFWGAVCWLAVPVSIIAVLLWLYLLKDNAVKASAWLFLCPIAGFAIAALLMAEPLSWHTIGGVSMVLGGLHLVQRAKTAV